MRHKHKVIFAFTVVAAAVVVGILIFSGKNTDGIQNILLISIDTCRADYLSCYGAVRSRTPQLDEIALQGILFQRAQTPVPMTLPAHCSMLTGTYPPTHKVRDNLGYRLHDSRQTLAEILKTKNYVTGGIVSSFILAKQFGTHQGFDSYLDQFAPSADQRNQVERLGQNATDLACDFLSEHQNEPFFLFLHYFDPHDPYQPPEPYASQYADDLYAGEIAYTDNCIGQVMDQLKELKLYDSTLIFIVGDHGEGLGDHDEITHEYFVYQSTMHVPFIIKGPGITPGTVCPDAVSLVDIPPTILSALKLPIPDYMQGIDLTGYFKEKSDPVTPRPVYIESLIPTKYGCNPLLGVVNQNWSFIQGNDPQLYDLDKDSGELTDLADQQPQRTRLMESQLQDLITQLTESGVADSQMLLDEKTRKTLESLGYVGNVSVHENLTLDPDKKDAEEMIACHELILQATKLSTQKQFAQAEAVCLKIIAQWPWLLNVYPILMRIGLATDNPELIIRYGQDYFNLNPEAELGKSDIEASYLIDDLATDYTIMAQAALQLERHDIVAEYSAKYLRIKPDSPAGPTVRHTLARACLQLGRQNQAQEQWDILLNQSTNQADVYEDIGMAYYQIEDFAQAEFNLNRAVQLDPKRNQARQILASLPQLLQFNQEITELIELLGQNPNDQTTHSKLANTYYQKGEYGLAINHWREAIRLKPDWEEPYNNLAGLLATTNNEDLKNPTEAVQLATKAAELTQYERVEILLTLTVAHAAAEQYREAIKIAEKALSLAQASGNQLLANSIQRQIKGYQDKIDG